MQHAKELLQPAFLAQIQPKHFIITIAVSMPHPVLWALSLMHPLFSVKHVLLLVYSVYLIYYAYRVKWAYSSLILAVFPNAQMDIFQQIFQGLMYAHLVIRFVWLVLVAQQTAWAVINHPHFSFYSIRHVLVTLHVLLEPMETQLLPNVRAARSNVQLAVR